MPQGTYILITKDGYRVTPMGCYESLFTGYSPDFTKYLNKDVLVKYFGDCSVFKTHDEVMEVAKGLSKAYIETDDGIFVMSAYKNYTFQELKDGKASKTT